MKFPNLNKYLGRHPNKSELSFINAIKKSYDVQNSYYSELNILKNIKYVKLFPKVGYVLM